MVRGRPWLCGVAACFLPVRSLECLFRKIAFADSWSLFVVQTGGGRGAREINSCFHFLSFYFACFFVFSSLSFFFCCLSHIVQIENCILVLSLVLTTVDFGELFSLFLDGGGRGRCWRVGLFGNAGALKHMFLRPSKYAGRHVLPRRVL